MLSFIALLGIRRLKIISRLESFSRGDLAESRGSSDYIEDAENLSQKLAVPSTSLIERDP